MINCKICGSETYEKNPVRVGFKTHFICDECLNLIKMRFEGGKPDALQFKKNTQGESRSNCEFSMGQNS